MRHYIHSIAFALLAGLGLTACNDSAHEDYNLVFPATEPVQSWVSSYENSKGETGSLAFSIDAQGDTVCNAVVTDSTGARTFYVGGKSVYDKQVGLTTIEFPNSSAGLPGLIYLIHRTDMKQKVMQVFNLSQNSVTGEYTMKNYVTSLTVKTSKGFELTGSWWYEMNNENEDVIVNFNPQQPDGSYPEGTVDFMIGEDLVADEGSSYVWDITTGTGHITTGDGTTIELSLNDKNQLVMTANGQEYVMEQRVE